MRKIPEFDLRYIEALRVEQSKISQPNKYKCHKCKDRGYIYWFAGRLDGWNNCDCSAKVANHD